MKSIGKTIRKGFLFYALSTLLLAIQFITYIHGCSILPLMDTEGWMFFIASCISHAAIIAMIPYLFYIVLTSLRMPHTALIVQITLVSLLAILNFLNKQVFALYRFHINGFVTNMVFGPGGKEIFNMNCIVLLKEAGLFFAIIATVLLLFRLSNYIWKKRHKAYAWAIGSFFLICTLFAHGWNIYASFYQHQSVMKSATLIPYFFPTTAYGFMTELGFTPPESVADFRTGSGDICYPVNNLNTVQPDSLPNILFILVDSWNKRAFTPECMPNAYRFAQNNQWFDNHISSSNGTRSSVFSIFFGLSCYYWESFEASHVKPLLVKRLLDLGYDFRAYPSAPLTNPDFARVLFSDVKNLRTETQGISTLERDTKIAEDFMVDAAIQAKNRQPFFSFLFFDLPHSFELSKEENIPFSPAWGFADYTRLNNEADPEPFFNLYQNCCYHDDLLIGRILSFLSKNGLDNNTIVILTGDHSQEFNENHKNFWGHNGNFSRWQIAVPLAVHIPGREAQRYYHRTTHYDFVPTLMESYLGVRNNTDDYSMGHLLTDTISRDWHVVGSNLNYAFIIDGDTILEKTATGGLDVYDADMNPVTDYNIDFRRFSSAVKNLNHFFK